MTHAPKICFALILPGPRDWLEALTTAFTHPWVASYQIGFGPPLVRANDRLIAAVAKSASAIEKLDAYLTCCYLDDDQRRRLAGLHRRLLVRRHGPLEAEAIRAASRDVLDLTVQLHAPAVAPPVIAESMEAAVPSASERTVPPEHRVGRFWVHLADPRNERMIAVDAVAAHVSDPEDQAVLPLTTTPHFADLYEAWLDDWAKSAGYPVVKLEGPVSAARAYRDGVSI